MDTAFNFDELVRMVGAARRVGNKYHLACPLCGPECRKPYNRRRRTLAILPHDDGSDGYTYICARCTAKGSAFPSKNGSSRPPVKFVKAPEPDKVLVTVLFSDIVGSTARAAELGDAQWRQLLAEHHARVRRQLARFRGVELDTAGDGFFVRFDGPARGIRCAVAIRDALRDLGLEVRLGLHTGECEALDGKVTGIAVSIGARVSGLAAAGEVLVSQTVKDLVAGSGLRFADRGTRNLRGVPEAWRLFAVETLPE